MKIKNLGIARIIIEDQSELISKHLREIKALKEKIDEISLELLKERFNYLNARLAIENLKNKELDNTLKV